MNTVAATVSALQLFGEPSRVRLLALLAHEELSVAELTAATRLAQSRVSTHLGKLREAGVLRDRRDGHSTYYSLNDGAMPLEAKRLWEAIQGEIKDAVLEGDRERCAKVLRARARGATWPDTVAGEMERHYSPGRTWESLARGVLALARFGDVLDVGCGDGAVAQLMASRAKSVTCLDRSEKMIAAAKKRLGRGDTVRCVLGDAEALPFDDESFDQVLLFNLLSCVESPAKVVREAARVLRKGGEVAVSVVGSHAHAAVTAEYGHLHAGFAPAAVRRLLVAAGLEVSACAITSREKRAPQFEVVTASARKD
ncbi:MAG: ArsR/SmtB family transcription factor [Polyangiaceae bacterium]